MVEDTASSLPPEMPPQMPSGFDAPGFPGGISSTENEINRLSVQFPEPEIPVPQYHSSVNQFAAAETVPPEDYLRRPNYGRMFSVVYDVNAQRGPAVKYTAGVLIEGTTIHNVPPGATPGELISLTPAQSAPLDADITWYLNVEPVRDHSKVSATKSTTADLSIPVAKMTKGRNGFIQQLHSGAVFLDGPSFGFEVQLKTGPDGSQTGIKVRPGMVMLNGSYVGTYPEPNDTTGQWHEVAFAQDGDVYIAFTFNDQSAITRAAIEFEQGPVDPYFLETVHPEPGGIFFYSFKLATLQSMHVIQYILGTIQIPVAGGTFFPYGPS